MIICEISWLRKKGIIVKLLTYSWNIELLDCTLLKVAEIPKNIYNYCKIKVRLALENLHIEIEIYFQ